MNKYFLPVLSLAITVGTTATAQTKEKEKSKKETEEVIRKKIEKKDKTTIVIDGDEIMVNGKPLSELKEVDLELLHRKDIGSLPRIKEKLSTMGGLKMFGGENFPAPNRALLGVSSEKSDKGAKVVSVEKESAAEKAGLAKDDIITKIGDTKIETSSDLYDAIGKYKPEEKVNITYLRNGKQATANATLGKNSSFGSSRSFNFNSDDLKMNLEGLKELRELGEMRGMNGMNFSFNRKPKLGLEIQDVEEGKGVKVLDVDSDSPAAKAGLQKDDVITEINGKTISSVDDLKDVMKDFKEGDSAKLSYKRAGESKTTDIKLPKKLKTAEL